MSETSIISARGAVYHYDSATKAWKSVDGGLSRVDIYHDSSKRTYRVVAVGKTQAVVINSPIFKELQYQKASEIFHQWSDGKISYGLNFASPQDAATFSNTMADSINKLKEAAAAGGPNPRLSANLSQSNLAPPAASPRASLTLSQPSVSPSVSSPPTPAPSVSSPPIAPAAPAAPAAPSPPPAPAAPAAPSAPPAPPAPPGPPAPPSGGGPPPPPPPPPKASAGSSSAPKLSLAEQIAKKQLNKVTPPPESSPSASSSDAPAAAAPAPSRPQPGNMMGELAAKMNLRKQAAAAREEGAPAPAPTPSVSVTPTPSKPAATPSGGKFPPRKTSTNASLAPPVLAHSASADSGANDVITFTRAEFNAFKQDLINTIRQEIAAAKQDILQSAGK